MSETFRPARPEEIPELARLVAHSFPGPARGRAWWEDRLRDGAHGGAGDLWVGAEDGQLVACCQLLPLRMWIGGEVFPTMGLGGVAILPTHRRRGLAGRLIRAGLQHARGRGDLASALYPFRIGFYEGLGYGLAGEAHQYQFPPHALRPQGDEHRRVRLVRGEADERALRAVYEAAAARQTGQLARTERAWDAVWDREDHAAVLFRGPEDEPEGYAVVRYRADLPIDERFLEVEERMWLTDRARRALYGWLGTLGDQWREIVYRAHPDEVFAEQLTEARLPPLRNPGWGLWFPSATLLRGPMFRLLDVAVALRGRTLQGSVQLRLLLRVEDEQLPENRGPWLLALSGTRIGVEPHGGGAADAALEISIEALSRVFIGALTVSGALAAGRARLDTPEAAPLLDGAFALPKPWTFDRF